MIEAIVAVYSDWGIGCCGTQPVAIAEDRRHFREITSGAAVIVGRRTLADFPGGRPLPGRANIVLSRTARDIPGAVIVRSVQEALCEAARHKRCLVIGGESVYRELLPHIERVYVTKIDCTPHSDSFFPNLDADHAWVITQDGAEMTSQSSIAYRFLTYERAM